MQDRQRFDVETRISLLERDEDEKDSIMTAIRAEMRAGFDRLEKRQDDSDDNTNARFNKVMVMSISILTALLTVAGGIIAAVLTIK